MRKKYKKFVRRFFSENTYKARVSLAADFGKAFWGVMALLGLSLPLPWVLHIAVIFKITLPATVFVASPATLITLAITAVALRAVQFVLEYERKPQACAPSPKTPQS